MFLLSWMPMFNSSIMIVLPLPWPTKAPFSTGLNGASPKLLFCVYFCLTSAPTLNGAGRRYRLGERGVQGLAFPGAKPGPMAYGPGRLYPSAAGYRPRATPAAVARISPPAQGLVMPGSSSGGRSGAGRFPGYAPARPGSGAGRNPGRRAASRCLRR